MHIITRLAAVTIVTVIVSGCGGSAGSSSALPSRALPAGLAKASFVVRIPVHTLPAASSRSKPQYISVSTRSLSVAIAPATGCADCSPAFTTAADLTPSSPGCTAASGATVCTLPISLKAGTYDATIATYDGPVAAGSPTGHRLSSDQSVPFNVLPNHNNAVALTLGGIPATSAFYVFSAGFPASLVGSTVTIDGAATQIFVEVRTTDADGNLIVGAGAPTVATATVSGNAGYKASPNGSGLQLTTPAQGSRTPATVAATLAAPNCPGAAVCSLSMTAKMTEFVGVADLDANSPKVYSERTQTFSTVPLGSESGAVQFNRAGDMFVAANFLNAVDEYAPPYTGAPIATITNGVSGPTSLAIDANNNLFVANHFNGTVTEYAPPYKAAPSATITGAPAASPYTIVVDAKNDLWIANDLVASAAYYLPAPVKSSTAQALPAIDCQGLAVDGAGNVDFSSASDGHIHSFDTTGAPVASSGIGEAFRTMTAIPPGNALGIGVIGTSPSGSVPIAYDDFTHNVFGHINSNGSNPRAIATDAQGVLYIGDAGNGTIATLAYPYSGVAQLLSTTFKDPNQIAIWP